MTNFHLICEVLDPVRKYTNRSRGSCLKMCVLENSFAYSRVVIASLNKFITEKKTWFQIPWFGCYWPKFKRNQTWHWRWKQQVYPKRRYLQVCTKLHGASSQSAAVWTNLWYEEDKRAHTDPAKCSDMKLVQLGQELPVAGETMVVVCYRIRANQAGEWTGLRHWNYVWLVKPSIERPGQALRVAGRWVSHVSIHSAHRSGKVFSHTYRPPSPSTWNIPGTNFYLRLSRHQIHSAGGRVMSSNISSDTIGNRTRDIPACIAVWPLE
jgi:hypothetical protein